MIENLISTEYGKFIVPPQDVGIRDQLVRFGAHQRTDLEMLLSLVRPGDIALDLGAHVGTYTIPLARIVRQVIAVEADGDRYKTLLENLDVNKIDNVTSVQALIAATEKTLRLSNDRRTDVDNLDRLWVEAEDGAGTRSVAAADLMQKSVGPLNVVKSDLEGMDFEIIYALRNEISASRPIICSEFLVQSDEAKAFAEFVHGLDYDLFINLAPRNSSMFRFQPHKLESPDEAFSKGIYDLFAGPRGSDRLISYQEKVSNADYQKLNEAFIQSANGEFGLAIDTISGLDWPEDSQASFLMANCRLHLREFDQAAALFSRAIERHGASIEAHIALARANLNCDQADQAAASARAALELSPNDHLPRFLLARALNQAHDMHGASEAIRHALRLSPSNQTYIRFRDSLERH